MSEAKLAYAIWPWGIEKKEQMIAAIKDIKDAGFNYFESVSPAVSLFKNDTKEFKSIMEQYKVQVASFYFPQNGDFDYDVRLVEESLDFLAENNIKRISVAAPGKSGGGATEEELAHLLKTLDKIGRLTKPYGIMPCLHPHANTWVMYEKEIDFIMQNTDPEYISLGPDTAHLTVGGCNPVEIFKRYIDRIKFIHLKDVKKNTAASIDQSKTGRFEIYSNFLELGEGEVDFPSIFSVLKESGYDGYLTVELDESRFSNRESAFMNMAYLKKTWFR